MADVQQLLVLHSEELKRLEKRVQVKYASPVSPVFHTVVTVIIQ